MSVGNDIVDLAIFDHHPRFAERVCTPAELRAIDSKRSLARIFAAKEAAYKAAVKLGLQPGFAHRKLEVSSDRVTYEGRAFPLSITDGPQWVHAVVGEATMVHVEEGNDARAALARALSRALGKEVTIVRDPAPGSWDGHGPPRVVGADADVSLSHDGRFVAFAAAFVHERVAELSFGHR